MNFIKVYGFFSITTFLSASLMGMEIEEKKKEKALVELFNNGVVRVVVDFNKPYQIRHAVEDGPLLKFDDGYIFKQYTINREMANGTVIELQGHIVIEDNYVGCGDVIENGEKVAEPYVFLFTEKKVNKDGSALDVASEVRINFYPCVHTIVKGKSTRKFPF